MKMKSEPKINGMPKSEYLTMARTAREAGLSRSTIDRARARGEFETVKYGRLRLIRRSEFDRWLASFSDEAEIA